jgi:hypothetical protein
VKDDELISQLARASREEERALAAIAEREPSRERIDRFAALALAAIAAPAPRAAAVSARKPIVARALPWVAALAVAAAVAVGFHARSGALLPTYSASRLAGEEQETRNAASAPESGTLRKGAPIDLLVRPETRVQGAIEARAFVQVASGEARAWRAAIDVAPSGVVRVHGTVDDAFAPWAGACRVVIVVARPGALPPSADEAMRGESDRGAWRAVNVSFVFATK